MNVLYFRGLWCEVYKKEWGKDFVQNEEIKNVTCVDGVCFCNSE